MKTTIEVPDELYRRAKALAAIRGGKIKDLVEEGLRLVVEGPRQRKGRSDLLQLMKRARGAVDSGISDLGSNPRHLEDSAAMPAIVDTGPLVAFFDRAERHHDWVVERLGETDGPLLVCEPVLTETAYLLSRYSKAHDILFELLENGALNIAFHVEDHLDTLRKLLHKYRDTPMSFADACVLRMAELHDRYDVMTLDSDFTVYRKHGRIPLKLIHPAAK